MKKNATKAKTPTTTPSAAASAPATEHAKAPSATPSAGAAAKPAKAPASKRSKRDAKPRRMSGLDATAKVLSDSGKPMRCVDIMEKIKARGLWKTSGKTPAATLNAAMIREITGKGKASRFKKAGRGLFCVGAKAATR